MPECHLCKRKILSIWYLVQVGDDYMEHVIILSVTLLLSATWEELPET